MFTQKISMDCTREQYDKYLKDELLKIGYDLGGAWGWQPSANTLTNTYNEDTGVIGCIVDCSRREYNEAYLGKFNADLFLALAAMTDNPNGNYGEWWVYTSDKCDGWWTFNELYKQVGCITKKCAFINDKGRQSGMHPNNKTYFRKATVDEIMEKFNRPEYNIDSLHNLLNISEKLINEVFSEPLLKDLLTEEDEKLVIEFLKSKNYKILKKEEKWIEI